MPPKFRVIRKWLRQDGFVLLRQSGSHEQYGHAEKRRIVTVAGKDHEEPTMGLWKSIRRQTEWDVEGKHNV